MAYTDKMKKGDSKGVAFSTPSKSEGNASRQACALHANRAHSPDALSRVHMAVSMHACRCCVLLTHIVRAYGGGKTKQTAAQEQERKETRAAKGQEEGRTATAAGDSAFYRLPSRCTTACTPLCARLCRIRVAQERSGLIPFT